MPTGQGNISVNQKASSGGSVPPFPLNSADNGLSVDPVSKKIVLGQSIGAAGNPAQLLSTREIPLNGFDLSINAQGVQPELRFYGLIDNIIANTALFIAQNNGNQYAYLNSAAGTFRIGDIAGSISPNEITIDAPNNLFEFNSGGFPYLFVDVNNDQFAIGDILSIGTGTVFSLTGSTAGISTGLNQCLSLDNFNGFYRIGDLNTVKNGSLLDIDSSAQLIQIKNTNSPYLFLDVANDTFAMGDFGGFATNTYMYIDNTSFEITPGGQQSLSGNNTLSRYIFGNFAKLSTDFIEITGGDFILKMSSPTYLLRTLTTLTNNAAANVGTLNNSPAAGDPTKWIAINDNGTVRYIPCW